MTKMRLADWIKGRLDELRAMVLPHHPPPFVSEKRLGELTEWSFDSSPANLGPVRKAVELYCKLHGLDTPACEEMGLVVNEALANVIRHAYGNDPNRPIKVGAEPAEGGVKLSIRDWGNGQDPSSHERRDHDPLTPGGLGLICMKRLTDGAVFEKQPDGMKLTLLRNRSGSKVDQPHEPERRRQE